MSDQTVLLMWHILHAIAQVLAAVGDVVLWTAILVAMFTGRVVVVRPSDWPPLSLPRRRPSRETPP